MPKPDASIREATAEYPSARVFDVGINERLPFPQLAVLALWASYSVIGAG